jgi:hypothetical protein
MLGSNDVVRHEDVRIPVAGESVAATRYEPAGDGPSPALLMYVPYHHQDGITYGAYDPLNRYLAAAGYEVVVADMVGTGGSTGFIEDPFTRREGTEPAEIVTWLADRPWTTGRVGMFGKSYGGITALDAAAQRPEGLEAIVPIHTPFEGVRNAYTYGGLFEFLTIGMDWLTLMQALDAKPPSNPAADPATMDAWRERLDRLGDREPWLFQFLDAEPHEAYWDDKVIPVERIDVPVLAVDGWRDPYTEDTLRYVDRIDAPTRVLFGPWRHRMPHRGRESAVDFRRQVRRWFDEFLRDEDHGVLDHPEFRVWTELDGGGTTAGRWRGLDRWPTLSTDGADTLTFALSPAGLVPPTEYDGEGFEETYEFDPTVGLASTDPYGATVAPPVTNDDDARSLTFDSRPLEAAVELTGTGAASLPLESAVADPTVVVRVVDVAPDGSGTLVTRGAVRGQYRDGIDESNPLTPGEEYDLSVPLAPKSHVFEAGHRVRVAVGSSMFPELLPTADPGSFTLRSRPDAPATVAFPGRRLERVAFDDAVRMAPPDDSLSASPERASGASSWVTAREHASGEARVEKTNEQTVDLPHGTLSRDATFEASVAEEDPGSASARNELRLTVENGYGTFEVRASNHISRSFCRVRTEVTHDGDPVFERTWTR